MGEVRTETADGILTVTLADVENRNALGATVLNGLHDAITEANADPEIRAVVVTNEGTTFCAGANLKQASGVAKATLPKLGFEELLGEIQRSPTPIVGKIKGHVVGGGNGLAAALDIAIARDDVKFGFTEVRLGVAPAIISVVCLPKMRHGEAMEAFLRGNRFPASRAAELGLISRAVPAEELDAAVDEVVADLRKGGPNALGFAKRLVYEVPAMEQKEAFAWAADLSGRLFRSEEAAAGMKAFLKREKPPWAAGEE
jgi:methylglutaconyl-CoA hydratase